VYRGIAISARVTMTLALLEIAIVVALSVWALSLPGPGRAPALASFLPGGAPSGSGLWLGVMFSLFCFAGFESVAPLAEESADPRRSLPRAIMASIALMGVFYLFCSFATLRGWGTDHVDALVRSAEAPLFVVARRLWSRAWVLVLVAVLNSVLGVCVACTTTSTRMFYAMGRAGTLPGALARVHPRFRTPTGAIWLQTALSLGVGLGLGFGLGPLQAFSFMGVVITLGLTLVYSAGNLGVFRLYRGEQQQEYRPILHLVCPALSTAALAYMGYRSLSPWPAAPLCFAPVVVAAWLGLGGGLMWLGALRARRARRGSARDAAGRAAAAAKAATLPGA
jgi:amino acid transporter